MNIIVQGIESSQNQEEGVKKLNEGKDPEDKKDKNERSESEEKASNDSESKNAKVLHMDTSELVRNVWDKVTKSYKETAQNLNDFVKNKLEYVASIRL